MWNHLWLEHLNWNKGVPLSSCRCSLLNTTDTKGLVSLRKGSSKDSDNSLPELLCTCKRLCASSCPGKGSYLGPSVGHVQVVQGHILDDFFLLVHISLWQGDILFSFKVEFCGIGITPALPLQRERNLSAWWVFTAKSPNGTLLSEIKVSVPKCRPDSLILD